MLGPKRDDQARIFESPTFDQDLRISVKEGIGTASISPSGRDVVLASQSGLQIVDLDSPYAPPRRLRHETPWTPADVQWSPFASRYYWIVTTSNQRVLVWNLELSTPNAPIEHVLHGHTRAITDINFSKHHPDSLATCAVGGFVHCWDLRTPSRPALTVTDWNAGASQVKWSLRNPHILASSHNRFLRIWDDRMGSVPVKSIDAHTTKIYGIDWSHEKPDQLLTCSLDRTIKIWAYEQSDTTPVRVIKTPVPIRRARHTPFGSGVVAMPQRADFRLHLYDQRKAASSSHGPLQEPDHSFKGHKTLTRDFLWRTRGSLENNVENREFQLITWGADNELILHRMQEKHLKLVGYEKGATLPTSWPMPGRGSPYTSFRDPPRPETPAIMTMSSQIDLTNPVRGHLVPQPLDGMGSPGMKRAPIPMTRNQANGALTMTYSSMQSRNTKRATNDLIDWMKGVKFGKRTLSGKRKRNMSMGLEAAELHSRIEALSEEIIHVGETFTKITFEEIDMSGRRAVMSFSGPWAPDKHMAFLRLQIKFPRDYPENASPQFDFERLSSVSDEVLHILEEDLMRIAVAHQNHQLGCLQAVLFYLLGEYTLDQSVRWLVKEEPAAADADADVDVDDAVDIGNEPGSSSDEEENLGEFVNNQAQTLEADPNNVPGINMNNVNVPLSNSCGACWAPDGRLVCFFLPKEEPPSMLGDLAFDEQEGKHTLFEGFGKLRTASSRAQRKSANTDDSRQEDEASDSDSAAGLTSDSSSESDEDFEALTRKFYPRKAWRGARMPFRRALQRKTHSTDDSQHLSATTGMLPHSVNAKSSVSIYTLENVLPMKHDMAAEYRVQGNGPSVCSHNALVAEKHNLAEIANMWHLLQLVLATTIPLSVVNVIGAKGTSLVMSEGRYLAPRVPHNGPDQLPLPADSRAIGSIQGDVKWSNHPFGRSWLVKSLYTHLEKRGDVQSLAMLSCVLARPSTLVSGDVKGLGLVDSSWPAPFFEYHTVSGLVSEGKQLLIPSEPAVDSSTSWPATSRQRLSPDNSQLYPGAKPSRTPGIDRRLDLPGQEEPPRSAEYPPSSLMSDFVTGTSLGSDSVQSPIIRNEPGSFATAWSRSFNLSPSPPTGQISRNSPAKGSNESHGVQAGTSNPTITGSGGSFNTAHSTSRQTRQQWTPESARQAEAHDLGSDTECDEPTSPDECIRVSYHNQSLFDDEGCGRVSLLEPANESRYVACRNAYARYLDAWGLLVEKQEVLKFNGIRIGSDDTERSDFDHDPTLPKLAGLPRELVGGGTGDLAGLAMTRCCTTCGHAGLSSTQSAGSMCAQCHGSMRILNCSICLEPVDALLKSCLNCGHVAHLRCLAILTEHNESVGSAGRYAARVECEAGCGCDCYLFPDVHGTGPDEHGEDE